MYKIDSDIMLKFFQSSENEEVKFLDSCFSIVDEKETYIKKVEFYTTEEDKPSYEYIEYREDSNILKVYIKTISIPLIEMACKRIVEIHNSYEGVEVCIPNTNSMMIDIIRKYFNISDTCDCEWGNYGLLSNNKLPQLNIPDEVKISLASSDQIETIKKLDNDTWEYLPERCEKNKYNIPQSRLLILLYKHNVFAGYIEAVCRYKNYYNICNVFVHEDFRGNGFGSLLTIYYANYCLNHGAIPHYGSAMSKYSENVAIKSGFEETSRYYFFTITR